MKKYYLLLMGTLIYSSLFGGVPVSSKERSQLVQGPCYTFAVVAALESKAIQDNINLLDVDFHEWSLYNMAAFQDVVDSDGNEGENNYIEGALDAILPIASNVEIGIHSATFTNLPLAKAQLPNPIHGNWNGIAEFKEYDSSPDCSGYDFNGDSYYTFQTHSEEVDCYDCQDNAFKITPHTGYRFLYSSGDSGYVKVVADKSQNGDAINRAAMIGLLNSGKGLIAHFSNWDNTDIDHGVFIYGFNGTHFMYLDSWPEENKFGHETGIELGELQEYYYLTGSVNSEGFCSATLDNGIVNSDGTTTFTLNHTINTVEINNGSIDLVGIEGNKLHLKPSNCSTTSGSITITFNNAEEAECTLTKNITLEFDPPTISGSSAVSNLTTYTISEEIDPNYWDKSSNIEVISRTRTSITVVPNNCRFQSGSIKAEYAGCDVLKSVYVIGGSKTPNGIMVQSANWNYGQTCPNTILPLEADDNDNYWQNTTYNWSISGATILSGQGTPYVMVRTSGSSYANLSFKVRAKYNDCTYSGWRTITGVSSSSNCSGGGGGPMKMLSDDGQTIILTKYKNIDSDEELYYRVITLDGRMQKEGSFRTSNPIINIGTTQRLLIVSIYDKSGSALDQFKYINRER